MNKKNCGKASLLDIMADLAHLDYLSDLRFMNREQTELLARKLQLVSVDDFPLRDWNAANNYLSQGPPVDDPKTAKAQLIAALENYTISHKDG